MTEVVEMKMVERLKEREQEVQRPGRNRRVHPRGRQGAKEVLT